MLIQLLWTPRVRWLRVVAGVVLLISFVNAVSVWSRKHDDLHWSEHVRSARFFSQYDVPVEFDGDESNAWTISAAGTTWDKLLRQDRWPPAEELDELPTFAYR